jgi:uncharacterized protein (UPF0261 family)
MATVVVVGTLDTKGEEFAFARERLIELGIEVVLVDFGILGASAVRADIPAEQVAASGGASLDELRVAHEGTETRAHALAVMTGGLAAVLAELSQQGRCDGVLGMGGSGGSSVASAAMRTLPVGLPKLLVSTMASGDVSTYVGESDLVIAHSVTDILGLNRLSRQIIDNACGAIAGMAARYADRRLRPERRVPTVGLTMFGVTTPCVTGVVRRLQAAGFETVVFHAVGSGGRAMESLVSQGLLDGVVDITTSELVDAEYGGKFPASPTRLRAAVDAGIPYVVVPGAMEVLNFGTVESVPERYREARRRLTVHNSSVCAVRTTVDESRHLGDVFGRRLAGAGPRATVVVPLQGFSNYSKPPDGPWIDDESDSAFVEAMERSLDPDVPVVKVPANINDPEFVTVVADVFIGLWDRSRHEHMSGVGL